MENLIEFLMIFAIFVLPSVVCTPSEAPTSPKSFGVWQIIVYFGVSAYLYARFLHLKKGEQGWADSCDDGRGDGTHTDGRRLWKMLDDAQHANRRGDGTHVDGRRLWKMLDAARHANRRGDGTHAKEMCENDRGEIAWRENARHAIAKKLVHWCGISIVTLLFLFANGFFWQKISGADSFVYDFPSGLKALFIQIFGIFVFAFFEEVLYRYFLPISLKNVLFWFASKASKCEVVSPQQKMPSQENILKQQKMQKRIFVISTEIVCVVLFAFAHKYMGMFAVLNAFFACIALRILAKKTSSIFFCACVHFAYNLALYIMA